MNMKETVIQWNFKEDKERPVRNQKYLVFGTTIRKGRMEQETRVEYWLEDGFTSQDNFVFIAWANIPTP